MMRTTLLLYGLAFSTQIWATIPVTTHVEGINDPKVKANVEHILHNTLAWLPVPTVDFAVRRFIQRSPDKIRDAMEPFGYFHAEVKTIVKHIGNQTDVTYRVTPGPVVTVSQISIDVIGPGHNDPRFNQARNDFSLRVGDTLQTHAFETAKFHLYNTAQQLGYFHGRFAHSKIVINLHTNRAQIFLHFNTGLRYRFGDTHFAPTPFAESFLRKFLTYERGEYYDAHKVNTTRQNFTGSPYFSQVLIGPKPANASHQEVPMSIDLLPRKKKQFVYGFGYGTDTGIRGTLGMDWRYINPYGHRFKTLIRASQENSQAIAMYSIPGSNPVTDSWDFTGGMQRINQTNGTANNGNATASYSTMLGGFHQVAALNYLLENYGYNYAPRTTGSVLYPSVTWSRLYLDKQFNPNNGYDFTLRIAATPASFEPTTAGFAQARGDFNALLSLRPGTRLLLRSDAGHMETQNINNIPLSLQLFAGGSRSVRGYSFNSIGPGRNLLVGSIELQQRIWGNFYLAAFYDIGNVANKNLFNNMHEGVGPAIVWLSPVGTLELSVARAISQPNKPWKVQFSMGPIL